MAKRIPWQSKDDLRDALARERARHAATKARLADVMALARLDWFARLSPLERKAAIDKASAEERLNG